MRNRKTSPINILRASDGQTGSNEKYHSTAVKSNTKAQREINKMPEYLINKKLDGEKLCGIPGCPMKSLEESKKDTKKVEKPSPTKKSLLPHFSTVFQKEVCRLTKEEKRLWKEIKLSEVGETEEFKALDYKRCQSKKDLKEILCDTIPAVSTRSKVKKEKKKTSNNASCKMTDCPTVAKKAFIEKYLAKSKNFNVERKAATEKMMIRSRRDKEVETIQLRREAQKNEDKYIHPKKTEESKSEHERIENTVVDPLDSSVKKAEDKTSHDTKENLSVNSETKGLPTSKKFYNLRDQASSANSLTNF